MKNSDETRDKADDAFDTPPQAKPQTRTVGEKLESTMFSLKHRPVMDVKVVGEVYTKSMPGFARGDDGNVDLLPVVDLDTGERGKLICTSVISSTFREMDEDYVGKCFRFVRGEKAAGKDYFPVEIYRLEVE